jgi:hypothetical protein
MNQALINMFITLFIIIAILLAFRVKSKAEMMRFKDLRVDNDVKSSDCPAISAFAMMYPEKAGFILDSIYKVWGAYRKDGVADTCKVCREGADPRCNTEEMQRWVFANCG